MNKTHGESKTRLYECWKSMKWRCNNPNSNNYHKYGGKGISVCAEWQASYAAFATWSRANGYADDLTIDRIKGAKIYCPEKCRWATPEIQSINRGRPKSNSSGFRGVHWSKQHKKWQAQIQTKGKKIFLGYFDTAEEAAHAYDAKAFELWGSNARLNFPTNP